MTLAAVLAVALVAVIAVFQLALALGAPLGKAECRAQYEQRFAVLPKGSEIALGIRSTHRSMRPKRLQSIRPLGGFCVEFVGFLTHGVDLVFHTPKPYPDFIFIRVQPVLLISGGA